MLFNKLAQAANPRFNITDNFGFAGYRTLGDVLTKFTVPAFEIAGTLVVLYFVFGAFKLLRSGGDKNEIQAAREMIMHSFIGLTMLLLLFLVIRFLFNYLFGINLSIINV